MTGEPRQFVRVRIPLPLVLLLGLIVMGSVWWTNTRHRDFLTPPDATQLAASREKFALNLRPAEHPNDALSGPAPVPAPPPPPQQVSPALELGDFERTPDLQEYSQVAAKGAAHLIKLATVLEAEHEPQRALLAWERVIDQAKPDANQSRLAIAAIQRLRPTLPDWKSQDSGTIDITMHATTGPKNAKAVTAALEETARDLERASAGILKVTVTVKTGRNPKRSIGSAPVLLWLSGPRKDTRSTSVISFPIKSSKSLREDLLKTCFQLISNTLAQVSSRTPPVAMNEGENPFDALLGHISRRSWKELGSHLNLPQKKTP